MIRTTKQVFIDSQNDVWGQVYVSNGEIVLGDIVKVEVIQQVLTPISTQMLVEGVVQTVQKNVFQTFKQSIALYKRSTWDALFVGLTRNDYDQALINSILFVNAKTINDTWTGQEIQRVSYYAKPESGGISQASDLEIVTPEILQGLNL